MFTFVYFKVTKLPYTKYLYFMIQITKSFLKNLKYFISKTTILVKKTTLCIKFNYNTIKMKRNF